MAAVALLAAGLMSGAATPAGLPCTGNLIVCENALPGTPQSVWGEGGAGDTTLQGFSTDISVDVGGTVSFKITDTNGSTGVGGSYHIDIYRLGYYGGLGAREEATIASSAVHDTAQPACQTQASTGLTDCGNWSVSASWTVPSTAVSGLYFANLVRDTNGANSHIYFVVRDDERHAPVLFQTSDATWEAYNAYGGNSLYVGTAPSSNGRGYAVSYNRPLTTGNNSPRNEPLYSEWPMIQWLEENGYDVSYTTDVDTARNGGELLNHKIFLSVGHDEYWSAQQRANVQAARDAGVDLAFFSGNEGYWKTRWASSIDGSNTPWRTLVSYKESTPGVTPPIDPADPPVSTGTWRDPRFASADGGKPENALSGTIFEVNATRDDAITVPAAYSKLRFWRNTSIAKLQPGTSATLPQGTLGYEWDSDVDNGSRPAGLFDMSSTTLTVPSSVLADPAGTNANTGSVTHSLTLYRAPSGALVFGAGTVQWSFGLASQHSVVTDSSDPPASADMQQATVNLLADMGVQPTTLQSTLTPATQSTDTTPPTSTITSPAAGVVLTPNQATTVTGTAVDGGGGVVAGVEVSTDGGTTWHPATGTSSWSYTFTPTTFGTTTIKSRAVDDSANLETPSAGVTVTVGQCPCSIFSTSTVPANPSVADANPYELGVKFRSDVPGYVTGIRFYKGAGNTGTHVGHLWSSTGTVLGSATFTNETATGWQTVSFASPIPISANTTYIASYFAPAGDYAADRPYFATSGVNSPPLHALQDGVDGANGVYAAGGGFPTASFQSSNYYVDVVFTNSNPPVVTGVTPAAGASGVAASAALTVHFNQAMDPTTITASTITLADHSGALVPATVTYDSTSQTATLTPSSPLSLSATYTATVKSDGSGVRSANGDALVSDYTWSFTTATPASCPCTIFSPSATPTIASAFDTTPTELGVKFRSDVSGYIRGIRFYKGSLNTGTHVAHLWTSAGALLAQINFSGESATGWQEVDFPTPIAVTANTTYVASYYAPNGGYALDRPFFTSGVDNSPLHALADGVNGPNGVYTPGTGFPSIGTNASNYWVDVVFDTNGADRTPPTVLSASPAAGSSGIAASETVSASFSEALNVVSVTSANVQLRDGSGNLVPAAVSYDSASKSVVLTPTSPLALSTTYTATVKGGAGGVTDVAGNPLVSDYTWSFTTGTPAACPCNVLGSLSPVVASSTDTSPTEVGVKFRSDVDGYIDGIRFYKGVQNTGTHVGHLWSSSGTLMGTATFTNESSVGWQEAKFSTPVAVKANTTYVASYFAPNGGYALDRSYFTSWIDQSPLHLLADGVDGPDGVYASGNGFPNLTVAGSATNYWVDVDFDTVLTRTAPTVTSTTPAAGATGVLRSAHVSATFSAQLDPTTVTTSTFVLRDSTNAVVPASVSYNATTSTATLVPTSPLVPGAAYTASLVGGQSGVKDVPGTPLAADVTWSFTVSGDVTPPATTIACNAGACGGWFGTSPVTVTLSATDAGGSGVVSTAYTLDGSDPTTSSTATVYSGPFAVPATATVRYASTDANGNVESPGSTQIRIDTTAPTTPSLTFRSFTNASAVGSTVFYNPAAAGGFTVGAQSSDPESGVASYVFPALGSGWGGSGGVYTFAAGAAAPAPNGGVTAVNGAGLSSAPAAFTVTPDGTPPATTIACSGGCNGWHTSSVAVTLAATDAASGVDHIAYSTDGSAPTTLYTGPFTVSQTTTVKFRSYDAVGNAETAQTQTVQVDTTPPTAPTLAFSGFTHASATGTTVYYNPAAAGGFTVTGSSTDPESGVASYSYPALGSGWSGTGSYTYAAGAAAPAGPNRVTATNNAALTSAATTFSVVADSTPPTAAVTCNGAACNGWYTQSPVTVALSAADGGAGIDKILYSTNGTTPSTLYTGAFTVAATATVRVAAFDRVGNEIDVSQLVQVDTTPPSAPSLSLLGGTGSTVTNNVLYYNPAVAGGFTVTAQSTDAESGVASYAFPAVGPGFSNVNGVYSFTAGASAAASNQVTATNAAGLTSSPSSFTVAADSTPPVTSASCNGGSCSGWFTTSPVSLTLASTDGGAGVDRILYSTNGTAPGTLYTGAISLTATTTVQFAAYDRVGNLESTRSVLVQVDTTPPTRPALTLTAGSGSVVANGVLYYNPATSGSFTVGASSSDPESNVASYVFPALGSGWSGSGGRYSFAAGAVQPAGPNNVAAVNGAGLTSASASFAVVADGTAPTTSIACTNGCAGWHTANPTVTLSATDAGSGVDRILYSLDGSPPSTRYTGAFVLGATTTVSYAAVDALGNVEATHTMLVQVDTTPPSAPQLGFTGLTNASVGSGTVWYNPAAAGGFTVTAQSTDAESGVASYAFPSLGSGWSGGNGAYTFAAGAVSPLGANAVTATNGAGLVSAPTSFTVTADGTAPTTTAACNGGGCGNWFTGPVSVSLAASDAASGVAATYYTTDGTTPSRTNGTRYSGPFTLSGTATVEFLSYDNVGNAETPGSQQIRITTTPPTAPVLSLIAGAPYEYVSASTLYYNPTGSHSASFTVAATASDPAAGIAKITFPAIAGMSGGGDDTTSPYQATYGWAAPTATSGAQTVTATSVSGLTSSSTFTLAPDTTPPSGGSVGYADGFTSTGSVTISTANGSDGGAGVDPASGVLQRDSSKLANGACAAFAGNWTTVSSPDTTISSGNCYRYRYLVSDRVGNTATYTSANVVEYDATAPSAPSLALASTSSNAYLAGSTLYYGTTGPGSFTVTASAADAESGIDHVTFPALAGMTGGGAVRTSPYSATYGWTAATTLSGDQTVTATNGAGSTSAASTFTVTRDASAPATTIACNGSTCASGYANASVTVSLAAADTGSGVASTYYTTDGTDPSTANGTLYTAPFTVSSSATVSFRSYDHVGNAETIQRQQIRIDTAAPSAPSLTLSAASPNEHVSTGTLYYNPTGANVGSFTVTATSSAASGIAKITFPAIAGMTGGGDVTSSPYQATYGWAAPTATSGTQTVTATSNSGLTSSSTFAVTPDTSAPTGQTLALAGGPYFTSASVALAIGTGGDGAGAGVDATTGLLERASAPLVNGSCGTWGAFGGAYSSPDTTVSSGNCYEYRYSVADFVGNRSTPVTSAVAMVDTTPPTAPALSYGGFSNTAVNGGIVWFNPATAGGFTITASATDGESGVASYAYSSLGSGWTNNGGSYSYTAGAGAPVGPDVVTATNRAGLVSTATSFTVAPDTTAPVTSIACDGGACAGWHTTVPTVTLTASDAQSGVGSILYSTDGTAPSRVYTGPFQVASTATVQYESVDRVGNAEAVHSQLVQVDTTPPSAPGLAVSALTNASVSGSTVFYRAGAAGGFTVTASSADAESGVASYGYPSLGSGWSNTAGAYSFSATATAPTRAASFTATNNAGLTSAATKLNVVADGAAPTTTIRCNAAACSTGFATSTVHVTLSADDGAGSGVSQIVYTLDGSDPTANHGTTAGGGFDLTSTTTVKFRAFDNVGNAEPIETQQIKIDLTPPSTPSLTLGGTSPGEYVSGTQLFYAPTGTNSGSFTVTASTSDADSGIAKVTFPALAGSSGGGDVAAAPYQATYGWTAASTASGTQTVVAVNGSGLTSSATFTVTPDTTAPSGGSVAYAGGLTANGSVTITTTDGSDNAGGAGIDPSSRVLERETATLANGVCGTYGAWTAVTSPDTVPNATCAQYRYRVSDRVGNQAIYTSPNVVEVDSSVPTGPALALSESSTYEYLNGNTLFYNPSGANTGSFSVAATTSAPSGIQKVTFPALAGMSGGGDVTASPYGATYSWTSSATATGAQGVTARSNAGATSTAQFTVTPDTSPPTGQTATLVGGPWYTTASVSVATTNGSDGSGSGLDPASGLLERATAPLANGACGNLGTTWTPVTSPDTTVQSGSCYVYRWSVADRVANRSTPVVTGVAIVDTTPPSVPALSFGGLAHAFVNGSTVYFNSNTTGGFTVSASSSDKESGVASYAFPSLGTGWSGSAGVYTFAANAADPAEPNNVVATNGAGLTSAPATFTVTADGAGPTGGSISYTDGYRTSASIALTLADGTDALSGVNSTTEQLQRATATMTEGVCGTFSSYQTIATSPGASYTDTSVATGQCYSYRYLVDDRVGNETTYTTTAVAKVDTQAPSGSLNDPGAYLRGTVSLSAVTGDTGGSGVGSVTYQRSDGSGGWVTIPQAWDTTTAATPDGPYDLRVVVTDRAGNSTISPVVSGRVVDNTAPSATLADPGAYLRGTVALSATTSDSGSGVASVTYQRSDPTASGGWSTIPQSWDTTTVPGGLYDLRVVVVDRAGNQTISTVTGRLVDNTPPTATMSPLGPAVVGTVTLTSTSDDGSGSGVASVTYERQPAGGTGWTATPATFDTTTVADGDYSFHAVVTDKAGNTTVSAPVTTHVDNTSPRPASVTPANGASNVSTSAVVTATFPRAMSASTITASTFTLSSSTGAVAATVAYNATTLKATLTPNAKLTEATTYTATLTTGVADANGKSLYQAYTWTFSTGVMPPTVTAQTPAPGATGISTTTTATATFSRAMDAGTINASSATISGPSGAVAATVSYDGTANVVTITPNAALSYNTTYTVQLAGTILSAQEVALAPVSWSFTTAVGTPTVVAKSPADGATGVPTATTVTAVFSRPMNAATLTASTVTLTGPSGAVAASVAYDKPSTTVTLTPTAPLTGGTTYTATIAATVQSVDGVALGTAVTWSFTTTNAPEVRSVTPGAGATNVTIPVTPKIVLSKPLDATTVTTTNVLLLRADGSNVAEAPSYNSTTNTITLTPSTALDYSMTYTIELTTGIHGSDGTPLAAQFTSTFTSSGAGLPIRIDAGSTTAYTAANGNVFSADTGYVGGTAEKLANTITGTSDPTLFQTDRYGTWQYSIPAPNGLYDVKLEFVDYTSTACSQRIFSVDILNVSGTTPEVNNLDIFCEVGKNKADVKTFTSVPVTGRVMRLKAVANVGQPEIAAIELIPHAPTATPVTPAAGATGVSVGTTVSATFSQAMDATSLTASTVTLSSSAGSVQASVAYNSATNTVTLTPNAPLAPSTTYTARLDGSIRDTYGMTAGSAYTWTFTTG